MTFLSDCSIRIFPSYFIKCLNNQLTDHELRNSKNNYLHLNHFTAMCSEYRGIDYYIYLTTCMDTLYTRAKTNLKLTK